MKLLFFILIPLIGYALAEKTKTHQHGGITLKTVDKESGMSADMMKKLVDVFFKVYPKMMQEFNPRSTREVVFEFDPSYNGIAATSGNKIIFSPSYFKANPKDVDVVTHEAFHVIQFSEFFFICCGV